MKRIKLAAVLSLFALTSCLNQTEPQPQSQSNPTALTGVAALEDMRGGKTEATFFAAFGRKPEAKNAALHRSYQVAAAYSSGTRAPTCELGKKAKTGGTSAASIAAISVGKVTFGPAMQGNVVTVEESSEHKYSKKIDPGFGAGLYQVNADGVEGVAKLSDYLSMPEELKQAKGNEQAFESGVVVMKDAPFKLTWQAPPLPNEANILVVDVLGETETEVFQLHCMARESELPTAGEWVIPVDQVSKLSLTEVALIYFVRAHVRMPRDAQWDAQLQGLRTYIAGAAIR